MGTKMKNNRENLSPLSIRNHRQHSHKAFLSTGLQREMRIPQGAGWWGKAQDDPFGVRVENMSVSISGYFLMKKRTKWKLISA